MSTTNKAVLDFLVALARVRSKFREQHVFLESLNVFECIKTTVSPFIVRDTPDASYALEGVTLNVVINAEVKHPKDPNKRSLEASILIRFASGRWVAEGEVGWSGRDMGCDVLEESQLLVESVEQLVQQLPHFADTVLNQYKRTVEDYSDGAER